MKKHRCLMAVLAVALLIPTLLGTVSAASSSEIKAQIGELKDSRTDVRERLEVLEEEQNVNWESTEELVEQKDIIDQQIALLYAEVENINRQIRAYTELIAANQDELDAAETRLAELNEQNRERIRAMEEEGQISFWSVLFNAKSFTELIDQLNMIEEIQLADRRRMDELSDAAEAVAEARKALETEKAALEDSRAELTASQIELDEKRAEADLLLAELNADRRALEQMQADYEAEEAELSAQIAAAEVEYTNALKAEEEARRREEEARRQESGGQTSNGGSAGTSGNESWGKPCTWKKLTSPYGYRTHPITGEWKFHNGVDLANSMGTPITLYAAVQLPSPHTVRLTGNM